MIFHHKVELLGVDTQNLVAWNFFECMSNQIENDFYQSWSAMAEYIEGHNKTVYPV